MSYPSTDRDALDALCQAIFKQGYSIDVRLDYEGALLHRSVGHADKVCDAVLSANEPCCLFLRSRSGLARAGMFVVLAKGDPEHLVLDYDFNEVTEAIWAEWTEVMGIA